MTSLPESACGNHRFNLVLSCSHEEFWRFNIYIIYELYDENNEQTEFLHKLDIVADEKPYPDTCPSTYFIDRRVEIDIPECHHSRVVIYILPFKLPEVGPVADYPPIPIRLAITDGGDLCYDDTLEVNQWGGKRLDFDLPLTAFRGVRRM